MNAIDFVKLTLELSDRWIMGLLADTKDIPMQTPTSAGGNHPLWCLGHLIYSEGSLVHRYAKGDQNPVAEWESLFKAGTEPLDDPSAYPTMDELFARAKGVRSLTMSYLDSLADEDLDKPSSVSEELKEWFPTVGSCLAAVSTHIGFHGGQIADARRAAGRPVLMG